MWKTLGLCNLGRKGFAFLASFSECKNNWYLSRMLSEGMTRFSVPSDYQKFMLKAIDDMHYFAEDYTIVSHAVTE